MTVIDRFAELVQKLTSTNGRLEKEKYLQDISADAEVLEILKFLFNPYTVTGISDKKLGKFKNSKYENSLFSLIEESKSDTTNFLHVLEYFKKNNTGRDEDVKYLVKFAKSVPAHTDLVYSIIKRDLKLGIQNTTINKVFGANYVPKFDVMLAENYADNREYCVGKQFIITEKFDGVRCILIFDNGAPAFFSRNGKPVLDLIELNEQSINLPKDYVYDGELVLENTGNIKSEDLYRATVKVTNSDGAKRRLYFNIFDILNKDAFMSGIDMCPCLERKTKIQNILNDLQKRGLCKNFKVVPIEYSGSDTEKITQHFNNFITNGAEGIMLNISDAPYECKRTKNLLKVKQFNTADVLVVDIEEGTGANRGKLGAVYVKFMGPDKKEHICKVGSGFKLDERDLYWQQPDLIRGRIIEIGYFELSRNQNDDNYSLRFPTFKHVRNDKTEISMY
ncbi:MAG: hypothetical protein LBG88_03665 [Christensenellaceae bacterium]|jgi:DNA ligase-1|nr:hypothetical protein [Christensenellaceae bacterium]